MRLLVDCKVRHAWALRPMAVKELKVYEQGPRTCQFVPVLQYLLE